MSVISNEVIHTSAPRLTVSSLSDLNCPRKYKDTRLDRNWDDHGVILAVANGIAVHRVLRHIYSERRGSMLDLSRLDALAREAVWGTKYPPRTDRNEAVARVIASVYGFVDADDEEAIAGVLHMERQGQFIVSDRHTGDPLFLASATLDRTLVRASEPHRLIVREIKTTAQRISLQEAFLILWVARKMYPDHGFRSSAIEYDFLDKEYRVVRETVEWEEAQTQSVLVLRKALRVFQANDYPAIPGEQCTYCRLRDECASLPAASVDLDCLGDDPDVDTVRGL